MTLAFFLGRVPALSLAEIYAVAGREGMRLEVRAWSREVLLVEVSGNPEAMRLVNQLGGVVKVAEITTRVSAIPSADDVCALLPHTERKIFFGISAYGGEPDAYDVPVKKLGLAVKRLLEEAGTHSRFVTSREDALSAVVVNTNKLLSVRGAEVVILSMRQGAYLGRTIWVQPYDEYAVRDMGRPQRDARVGMLPPKLAHMMVNLALGAPAQHAAAGGDAGRVQGEHLVLLDPCCGSGTVLQEAALIGVSSLIGTDRDGEAIKRTHDNLQWLTTMTPAMRTSQFSLTLKCAEVKSLPALLGPQTVDMVAAEPSLGPPQTRHVSPDEARQLAHAVAPLHREVLGACAQLLRPGGRAVVIWPVWRTEKGPHVFLDEDMVVPGLVPADPLAFSLPTLPSVSEGYLKARHSLLYQREDQFVLREIRIFDKVEIRRPLAD